ncbi:hypothetical protein NIES4074_19710 [Cylindrospermum sp. NIES-4074]|nr:hypothetical protein NIES4074_19710 [Cylindrospermum sp. NIES-4074]
MTSLNNQVISNDEQKVIDETVHETLSEFCDELKKIVTLGDADAAEITDTRILEGSCFYYAALGSYVCTKFYRQEYNDTKSCYLMQAGYFALRPYKDKTQESRWFRYSGEIYNNQNDYHCWIVGPLETKDNTNVEIIDFTARHYKNQVDKKPDLTWEREDLENMNFIWSDSYVSDSFQDGLNSIFQEGSLFWEYGLIFRPIEDTTNFVLNKWKNDYLKDDPRKNDSLPKRMMKKSEEILRCKLAILRNQPQSSH